MQKRGDKLKAFFGSRFSPNMTRTPEGYLICHNVPIARTGEQQYLGQELGLKDLYGQTVKVVREASEVFAPAAVASFEGKPVTDNHPSESLIPSNYSAYLKGVAQNVRRGTGENEDKLLADLVIYDPKLINEIEAGKREISCGYDCQYREQEDGSFGQTAICGNHVAVVNKGRAGANISIRDESPEKGVKMTKPTNKKGILAKMFHVFAKDAETTPEELEVAMDSLSGAKDEKESQVNDEPADANAALLAAIEALTTRVAALEKPAATDEVDPMEHFEKELLVEEDEAPEENSVTISPEDVVDNAAEIETTVADRQTVLTVLKAIKPIVAGIKDTAEKKRVADSLTAELKKALVLKQPIVNDGYKKALEAKQKNVKALDSAIDAAANYKAACDARNPHKQGGKK